VKSIQEVNDRVYAVLFIQFIGIHLYVSGYPLKCIVPLFPIGTRNLHSSPATAEIRRGKSEQAFYFHLTKNYFINRSLSVWPRVVTRPWVIRHRQINFTHPFVVRNGRRADITCDAQRDEDTEKQNIVDSRWNGCHLLIWDIDIEILSWMNDAVNGWRWRLLPTAAWQSRYETRQTVQFRE